MTRRVTDLIRWCGSLHHLSLVAVIAWTSHAHWELAIRLGAPAWLAPLLPVAIDAYVLSSFRAWEQQANRGPSRVKVWDLAWALTLDMVTVAGSHAISQLPLPAIPRAIVAACLGVILVLTLWRGHALDVQVRTGSRPATTGQKVRSSAVADDPTPAPVVTPVTPELTQAPADADPVEVTPERSTLVEVSGPVDLDRWVARQFAGSAQRAEVMRVGAARFGVSESTVKRRWQAEAKADGVRGGQSAVSL